MFLMNIEMGNYSCLMSERREGRQVNKYIS